MYSIETFQGKTIKCRAAVAYGPKKPLVLETVDLSPPRSGEVRIKIIATGVCLTDVHSIDGHIGEIFPLIFGHEGSGIVESVGENVNFLKVGDHVIPSYMFQCNDCDNCKNPDNNFCVKTKFTSSTQPGVMEDGTTRFSINGKPIYHFMSISSFSEYTVVHELSCCKINPVAPLEKVCLLGCGISTGYGCVFNVAKVKEKSSVAVWGLGSIGLAVINAAKLAGAKEIIGIDLNPAKYQLAKDFGATECLNPTDNHEKTIQQVLLDKYNGIDYTFECIGNVNVMRDAIESTKVGQGVCSIVGVAPENQYIKLDPLHLLMGITIKGSCFGGLKSRDDIPKLVEKYLNNEIRIDEFITNKFRFDQINEALDLMRQGEGYYPFF